MADSGAIQVRLADQLVDALDLADEPSVHQEALRTARQTLGHGLCGCVVPERKLQIRERASRLHAAVWPQDGSHHAVACPFRRVHEAPGQPHAAVVESDEGFDVKIDASFLEHSRAWEQAPVEKAGDGAGRPQASPKAPRGSADLQVLMDLLWRRADLDRWLPHWKRDYWRVAKRLQLVVEEGHCRGRPLEEIVQIVPPWREHARAEILNVWEAFDRSLDAPDGEVAEQPTRLIVGELSHLHRSRFGWQLRLKHTRPTIFLNSNLHTAWARHWGSALLHLQAEDGEDPASPEVTGSRVFGMLQVLRTRKGNHVAIAGHLMPLDRHYMPASNGAETLVCGKLIEAGRAFMRGDAAAHTERDPNLPRVVYTLLDTDPPTPVSICMNVSVRSAFAVEKVHQAGLPWWLWNLGSNAEMPAFDRPGAEL